MMSRLMQVRVIGLLLTIVAFGVEGSQAISPPRQGAGRLDEQLTELGVKLFSLNMEIPTAYARAFKEEGAGEGLLPRLFNDAIAVLELALEQNDQNIRARFYLAKSYFAKSAHGEGRWSRPLLARAEHHFSVLLSAAARTGMTEKMRKEARQALDDIRKIRQGQGELIE